MQLRTNRDFRRLFVGRVTTNAGDSLYLIATMWLVHDLTGSTLYTGLAAFLLTAPNALGFLFGPLADRWPASAVLVWTQLLQAVVLAGLVAAWALGYRHVWLLLAVIPILMLVNQLVYPTMNAVLPRVVDRDALMDANAAFAIAFQGLDMTFNAIAGIVIAVTGALALYTLDVATFLVAAITYATVRIPARRPTPTTTESPTAVAADGGDPPTDTARPDDPDTADDGDEPSYRADLLEGIAVFRGTALWKLSAAVFLGIASYWLTFAVLPAYAAASGGPALYGLLLGGLAGGTLLGFLLAPRLRAYPLGRVIAGLSVACGAAWFLAFAVPWVPATIALVGVATIVIGVFTVTSQTLFQTAVPDAVVGRVVALQMTVAGIAAPTGALLGGIIGAAVGVDVAITALGVGHFAVAATFLLDHDLRTLPAVSTIDPATIGLESA